MGWPEYVAIGIWAIISIIASVANKDRGSFFSHDKFMFSSLMGLICAGGFYLILKPLQQWLGG